MGSNTLFTQNAEGFCSLSGHYFDTYFCNSSGFPKLPFFSSPIYSSACTRCSVLGESGDEQDGRVGLSSHCACHMYMLCSTQYPTILPFQSQSPKGPCGVAWLADSLHNSSSWSRGAGRTEPWSPARSTQGKSHTHLVHDALITHFCLKAAPKFTQYVY